MGNRYSSVNQFNKAEKNWKRDMKYLRKHKKIIYSIYKRTIYHKEITKIKKIR